MREIRREPGGGKGKGHAGSKKREAREGMSDKREGFRV
jgi:hypothetical protein